MTIAMYFLMAVSYTHLRSENRSRSENESYRYHWAMGVMRRLNEKGTTLGLNIQNSDSWGNLSLIHISLDLGNVHIYENNIDRTLELLSGVENIKFDLNV